MPVSSTDGDDPLPGPCQLTERWYRLVGPRRGQLIRHFIGVPVEGRPVEQWGQLELSWPRVLILFTHPDGPMIFRYTGDATFAGDTWHETLEDARSAAEDEYSGSLESGWAPIPDGVSPGHEPTWALELDPENRIG